MRRLFPILVIPILLAGRPVGLVHCHAGNPDPHVHLDECCHESHESPGSDESQFSPQTHHDDDAVYVSDEPSISTRSVPVANEVVLVVDLASFPESVDSVMNPPIVLSHPPPIAWADCPRFIVHLSILI